MRFDSVFFDMDGVILDSEPLHFAAFQATLGDYGHRLDKQGYIDHFAGMTDEEGFKRYFQFVNQTVDFKVILDQKGRKFLELSADQLVAYPGVVELIHNLSEAMPLSLVTGSTRVEAETALGVLGIANCFQHVITADDVAQGKPNPEPYLLALEKSGLNPDRCAVIEDSPSGVKAAKAAGLFCIAVTNTHNLNELSAADKVLDKLNMRIFE